jgi:hypothetical protein
MNKFYLNSVKNTALSSKPSTTIHLLLMVLFVYISPIVSFGQCTYPTATATSVGTYTFCIDNSNTITTASVKAGQYALVNVIKGFTYTFSVGDVFSGTNPNEILSIYNDFDNSGLTVASGSIGASITGTAINSGKVKVLLSRGGSAPSSCVNDGSTGGTLSLKLISLGNTQDSQTASGTNTWIGHIYNSVAGASPEPFTNANYAGYYTVGSETISEGFGGDAACFPVFSSGTQYASIYTEQFAVRYRMQSTRAAGYYFMNANADDGIRATVDGVTVLSNWTDHANTQYCNNLVYLNGSSNIVLDYYENGGGNVVGVNFAAITGNSISSYADINVCSGASPGNLNGSNILSCTGTSNTTYQWQSSTDNVTFTNISGATAEDYTPTAVTTTSVDVKYYRRVLVPFGAPVPSQPLPATGSVKVITNPPAPVAPVAITGATAQCAGNTLQLYSVAAVTNATSYNWTLPANWTITGGTGTNSITVSIASNGATGNVSVNAANGCGTSASISQWVVVSTPTVAGTVTPANTNVCSGSNSTNLGLSGNTGSVLRWESSTDNFAGGTITTIASTGSSITVTNITVNTYYRAVVQSGGCNILNTSSVKLTVVGAMANPGGISINGISYPVNGTTTNCASTTMTFSIAPVANATSYTWAVVAGWTIVSGQGTTTVSVTTGNSSQSNNISVYAANGTCPQTGSTYLYVTLANNATPTGTAAQFFCSGATVANLTATGSNITWYTSSTGGTALASTTVLTNGTHYYATQNPSGCESTTRFDVTATVTAMPTAPTIGTTTQPTCSTATGSVVIGGLPSGSWVLTSSPGSITTTGTGTSTTISGLAPGTTYTYTVNGLNNGLKGEYFNNMAFTGSAILTRVDATVGFDWTGGSPDSSINVDNFSARWSGFVQPLYSETYTFSTSSDDGIRLWVNGVQIINNWTNHAAATDTGTITLTAGVIYNIVLEYYENTGQAVSKLSWSSPSQVSQIIPSTQLYSVSSCGSPASANVVINAQPATPSIPTVGIITQPDCVNGGSVVLSGLPSSGTWTVTRSPGAVTTSGTGVSTTISGLAVGSYTFTVSNGSCTSSATAAGSIVINAAVTNTWNGASWDNGTPTISQALIFSGDYSSTGDINGCSCTVNIGKNVIINSGNTLKITNAVTVSGTGTLTFENTSSLVQTNNAAINSGNITYKRASSSALTSDYTYWSSPVVNQSLNISPSYAAGMFYSYDDFATPEGWKKETAATIMQIGKGYIIRGPQITSPPPPPGIYNATFVGTPNNGIKNIYIGPSGTSNLLGNPYPSAINADTFLSDNSAFIEGTLYFWTHNTAIQLAFNITGVDVFGNPKVGSGALAYTSDDYASYNGTGGVAVSGGVVPTGKIAAGQAFFTTSKTTGGAVTYTNAMRLAGTTLVDKTGINQQFFKTKNNAKTTNAIEKDRIWLNLSNDQGAFKQTLVGYITDATNDYDSRFDGESFDGNEFVDFYSVNNDKNLVIQGRALPFDENDTVPLGFKSTIDGDFTINIDQTDGLLASQPVFIEDKLTNTVTNLKTGNYTFNTVAGTFNDRFVLRYTDKTLGTTDFNVQANTVLVSIKNKQIKVNSFAETINMVTIYDLQGRQIYQKDKVNNNEFLIADFVSSHETLIVKTSLQNGKTVTDKIIY